MIHADDPQHSKWTVRRHRVKDAAVLLGISTQAIRHRIRRGTLDSEKDDSGVVWVRLDPETVSADYPPGDPRNGPQDSPQHQSLPELVEVLREQLAEARERERRSDERERELRRIIAGLVQRVPELPSPDNPQDDPQDTPRNVRSAQPMEARDAHETPSEGTDSGAGADGDRSEPRRSWWQRLLGVE
jgi:hypothetical protein